MPRPDFIESEEAKRYFNIYRATRSYDDEQKLILMSLHYNAHLRDTL
jgi:hypothetical protein